MVVMDDLIFSIELSRRIGASHLCAVCGRMAGVLYSQLLSSNTHPACRMGAAHQCRAQRAFHHFQLVSRTSTPIPPMTSDLSTTQSDNSIYRIVATPLMNLSSETTTIYWRNPSSVRLLTVSQNRRAIPNQPLAKASFRAWRKWAKRIKKKLAKKFN